MNVPLVSEADWDVSQNAMSFGLMDLTNDAEFCDCDDLNVLVAECDPSNRPSP